MIIELFFGLLVFLFFILIVVEYRNLKIISALKREHHENVRKINEALDRDGIDATDLEVR